MVNQSVVEIRQGTRSTLFPYTTLFRSKWSLEIAGAKAGFHMGKRHMQVERRQRGHHHRRGVALRDHDVRSMQADRVFQDRKSTRLNSSHGYISYAVFCLKKKKDRNSRQ